jgi:hypothetical protein
MMKLRWEMGTFRSNRGDIKDRISKHYHSFKSPILETKTTLIGQMWRGELSVLKYSKVAYAKPQGANQLMCNLYNMESLSIMRGSPDILNSRAELGDILSQKKVLNFQHSK